MPSVRRSSSAGDRSPRRRSTSCSSSALRARRPSVRHCSSSSRSARTPGSSSSRSSSAPSSSRNRSRSSASAAARRSASGASPSYMYAAIQLNSRLCANGDALAVSTLTRRTCRLRSCPSTSRRAGTSNTSCRHSRLASSRIGKLGYFAATASRSAARWRCCQSGVRVSGRRRGRSRARAAHSRKRAENNEVWGSVETTSSSMSSGSISSSSMGRSSAASGRRMTMPSSLHIVSTGRSYRSMRRRSMAMAHGACTGVPKGLSRHTRQSPISSRKRSTTTVRSSGTTPVASTCSVRYSTTLAAAQSSRSYRSRRCSWATAGGSSRTSRRKAPSARPSSSGRPGRSPCQNGILPGCPGAGVTTTRSKLMSSIRQVDAPSRNVSPGRLSYTISSSSSPTRVPSGRNTPNSPRSGMVPPLVTARRRDPSRARSSPPTRSHTIRGRSSPNSSLGYRPASRSSTLTNRSSVRSAKPAHRRTSVERSSTEQGATATWATICCARTSSGLRR